MNHSVRVTVLRGGPSAERSVSLEGGAAVAGAARRLGYRVTEADIGPDDLGALDIEADVVFPVLHGTFGEDGQLQAILEKRKLPYVGSDAAASRLAIDKDASKRAWQQAGLPTAPWTTVVHWGPSSTLPQGLSPPIVMKPLAEGSSIGIRVCNTPESLQTALADAVPRYGKILLEKRLFGPELTVGILAGKALPVIQVKPAAGFYDYEAKYRRDDTAYMLQPEIDQETYRLAQDLALRAFQVLGCRDFARLDLIVDRAAGPQLLEANTLPGFTSHSLLPKAAAHVGIDFDRLVAMLLEMACRRGAGNRPGTVS